MDTLIKQTRASFIRKRSLGWTIEESGSPISYAPLCSELERYAPPFTELLDVLHDLLSIPVQQMVPFLCFSLPRDVRACLWVFVFKEQLGEISEHG